MLYTATQSTTARIAQLAIDAATSQEAIAFYCELLELSKAAGNGLRRFSEQVLLDIVHGAFYFATLLIWGLASVWSYITTEVPRLARDARTTIRQAVAMAQGEPLALPWSCELSPDFLAHASEGLEIEWPEPNPDAVWVTGMMI